jgi:hypothetical protein
MGTKFAWPLLFHIIKNLKHYKKYGHRKNFMCNRESAWHTRIVEYETVYFRYFRSKNAFEVCLKLIFVISPCNFPTNIFRLLSFTGGSQKILFFRYFVLLEPKTNPKHYRLYFFTYIRKTGTRRDLFPKFVFFLDQMS